MFGIDSFLSETSLETTLLFCVTLFLLAHLTRTLLDIPFVDDIPGRFILVTGCDSGLGYHLTLKLDGLGCNVIATCYSEDGAAKLKEVTSERTITPVMDVTDSDSISRVKTEVEDLLSQNNKGLISLSFDPSSPFLRLFPCILVCMHSLSLASCAKNTHVFSGYVLPLFF